MNPLSERLVFNKTEDQTDVVFSTDKKVYEKRELISSTIELPDIEGNNQSGHLSIAITDDKDVSIDTLNTITSSLLLSSELRGYIETPAYYLQNNGDALYALDHLMMTHGWRRYNIPEVIKGNMEIPEKPFEVSKEISGLVKRLKLDRPVVNVEVMMLTTAGVLKLTETNENGEFLFTDFETVDSANIFIHSLDEKGSPDIEVVVNEEMFPDLKHIPDIAGALIDNIEAEQEEYGFFEKAEQRAKYDEDIRVIYLDEVTVTAKRPVVEKDEIRLRQWQNRFSDMTLYRDSILKRGVVDVYQAFSLVPGVLVRMGKGENGLPNGSKELYTLRGGGEGIVKVLIDGFMAYDYDLEALNLKTVNAFDIFRNINAGATWGALGNADILINITTGFDNSDFFPQKNFFVHSPLGFQAYAEFYSPKYDTPESKNSGIPDYRTTIFWKPDIVINEDKKALFEFYASDFATTYSVVIEGITNEGRIIRRIEKIEIK